MNYFSHLLSKQLSTLPEKKNSLWPFLISSPICHQGRQYLKIICYLPLTGDSTESRGTASKYSDSSERECWLKWRFHDVKTGHLLYLLQHARAGLPPPDINKIYYLTNLVLKKNLWIRTILHKLSKEKEEQVSLPPMSSSENFWYLTLFWLLLNLTWPWPVHNQTLNSP